MFAGSATFCSASISDEISFRCMLYNHDVLSSEKPYLFVSGASKIQELYETLLCLYCIIAGNGVSKTLSNFHNRGFYAC